MQQNVRPVTPFWPPCPRTICVAESVAAGNSDLGRKRLVFTSLSHTSHMVSQLGVEAAYRNT